MMTPMTTSQASKVLHNIAVEAGAQVENNALFDQRSACGANDFPDYGKEAIVRQELAKSDAEKEAAEADAARRAGKRAGEKRARNEQRHKQRSDGKAPCSVSIDLTKEDEMQGSDVIYAKVTTSAAKKRREERGGWQSKLQHDEAIALSSSGEDTDVGPELHVGPEPHMRMQCPHRADMCAARRQGMLLYDRAVCRRQGQCEQPAVRAQPVLRRRVVQLYIRTGCTPQCQG